MKSKTLTALLFILLFSGQLSTHAAIPSQMVNRFATLSGSIIIPIADEYLIDIDASAKLQIGDILTLVTPGEKVLHPITQEVLGTIDTPTGFLQVTRILSGYSYARLLYADTTPQKGNLIRRFDHVPSRFIAAQGDAAEFYRELKNLLPRLNWLQQNSAVEPLLFFTLDGGTLSVTTASQQLLYSSPIKSAQPSQ